MIARHLSAECASCSSFETLEPRVLLAGDVTAILSGGNLLITGDGELNHIVIDATGLPAGQFRITSGANVTTINSQAGPTVFEGITGDIRMTMNGGDDIVVLDDAVFARDIVFVGGAGDDALQIGDTAATTITRDVIFRGDAGDDLLLMMGHDSQQARHVKASDTDGGLSVLLEDSVILGGNLQVVSTAGTTDVRLGGASAVAGNVDVRAGDTDGEHILQIAEGSEVSGSVNSRTGEGDHTFILAGSTIGRASVRRVGGNTTTVLMEEALIVGNLIVRNGDGADSLNVGTDCEIQGNLTVDNGLGGGHDTVLDGASVVGNVSVRSREGAATFQMINAASVGRNLSLRSDAGATSAIIGSTVDGHVIVRNRAGADSFTLNGGSVVEGKVDIQNGTGGLHTTIIDAATIRGQFLVRATEGEDQGVISSGATILGNVSFRRGDGDADLQVVDSTLGGNLTVRNGNGENTLTLSGAAIAGSVSQAEGEGLTTTTLEEETIVDGNLRVTNRDGNNVFTLAATVNGNVNLTFGAGAANQFDFEGGQVGGNLTVKGSLNVDNVLFADNTQIVGLTRLNLGAGSDVVVVDNTTFSGRFEVNTGIGADSVAIEQQDIADPTRFLAAVLIRLGDGDDTLNMGLAGANGTVIANASVTLDGQAGDDTRNALDTAGWNTFAVDPVILNFETIA